MKLTLDDILKATGGTLIGRCHRSVFDDVSTDTRTIKPKDIFVAIKGPHFDGHDFIPQAVKRGAGLVIAGSKIKDGIVLVPDTIAALGNLAAFWRSRFTVPCVAITGSNGKSTTKEMVASIAGLLGPVLKTEGNFNNLIGLPLTIFRWDDSHKTAVLEMGMNALGEIGRLTRIAAPQIGLITNITAAHLEKLHTLEGVARAKGELFEELGEAGTAIINDEDPWIKKIGSEFKGRRITFGMQNTSEVQFRHMESSNLSEINLTLSIQGYEKTIKLPLPGTHNVMNAMAAIACGLALNLKPDEMLSRLVEFKSMPMRFERVQLTNGVCMVNDCYNANPQSMKEAFRTISGAKRAGRFIAVLGDMLELGPQSESLHNEVGRAAVEFGVDRVFLIGDFAESTAKGVRSAGLNGTNILLCRDVETLKEAVEKEIQAGDILLIKGSRMMRLERIAEYLKHSIGCG